MVGEGTWFPETGHLKSAGCEQLLQVEASSSELSLQWVLPSHQCCEFWQTCQQISNKALKLLHLTVPELAAEESRISAVETLISSFIRPIITVHLLIFCSFKTTTHPLRLSLSIIDKYFAITAKFEAKADILTMVGAGKQMRLGEVDLYLTWRFRSTLQVNLLPGYFQNYLSTVWAEHCRLIRHVVTMHLMATSIDLLWKMHFPFNLIWIVNIGFYWRLVCFGIQ